MKDSKTRLLQTAFELFALKGLDGVSTREIVKKAGVNIHAISYYFGGKDGLYEAVVDYLINTMREESKDFLHFNEYRLKVDSLNKEETLNLLLKGIEELIDFDFVPKNNKVVLFLTREELNPTKYNKKFYEALIIPLQEFILKCICKITGMQENEPKTLILSHMIMAQIIRFGRAKRYLLKNLKKGGCDVDMVKLVKEMTFTNAKAILKQYTKEDK